MSGDAIKMTDEHCHESPNWKHAVHCPKCNAEMYTLPATIHCPICKTQPCDPETAASEIGKAALACSEHVSNGGDTRPAYFEQIIRAAILRSAKEGQK